jgi:hypothetical protein
MRSLCTAFTLLFFGSLLAQDFYVDVEVSNTAPAANEQIKLVYRLKFKGRSGSFNLSGIQVKRSLPENFELVQESQGMNMSWGLGGFGEDMTLYQYAQVLKPTRQGAFTLSPVEFVWNGRSYKSQEVKLGVGQAPPESERNETREYFIETSLSKTTVYLGEQLTMTLRIYSQREMRGVTIGSEPSFKNFYRQELPVSNRMTITRVGGRQYYMNELLKFVLTPISAGEIRIDPYEVTAQVVIGRGFFADLKPVTLRTGTAGLNVRSIPSAGRPTSFDGAVGNFTLKSEISSEEIPTDEPITYRITVSGDGDFNFVKNPVIDLPPDFEVYDPKITTDVSGSKMSGSKTFEYLIIPRRQGEYALKPYTFSWFDPVKQRYNTASTPAYRLKVTKGTATGGGSSMSSLSREEVELLAEDIRYIKTAPLIATRGITFGSLPYVALMVAPVILFLPLFFVKRHRMKRLADDSIRRHITANRLTRRNMAAAKRLMNEGDVAGFHRSLQSALEGWLAQRLHIAQSDLSKTRIENELHDRQVSPEVSAELRSILDNCEIALYAPSTQAAHMNETWGLANKVMSSLQSVLR